MWRDCSWTILSLHGLLGIDKVDMGLMGLSTLMRPLTTLYYSYYSDMGLSTQISGLIPISWKTFLPIAAFKLLEPQRTASLTRLVCRITFAAAVALDFMNPLSLDEVSRRGSGGISPLVDVDVDVD